MPNYQNNNNTEPQPCCSYEVSQHSYNTDKTNSESFNVSEKLKQVLINSIDTNISAYLPNEQSFSSLSSQEHIIEDIHSDNLEYKNLLEKNQKDYYGELTQYQKNLVRIFDKSYFPKTFNSLMCEIIDKQYGNYIKDYGDFNINYIPVFVPKYYCINKISSYKKKQLDEKMLEFDNLEVVYITSRKLTKIEKSNTDSLLQKKYVEYFFASTEHLKNTNNKPKIYVIVPDSFVDENMQVKKAFEDVAVRYFFYDQFDYYKEFMYLLGKFTCDYEFNTYFGDAKYTDSTKPSKSEKKYSGITVEKINFYEQFSDLNARVYAILQKIHNKNIRKRLRENTQDEDNTKSKKQKIEDLKKIGIVFETTSLKQKYKYSTPKEFININNKVNIKYYEEKINGTYNINKILDEGFVDESAFMDVFKKDLVKFIENRVNDINILGLNNNNDLLKRKNIAILLPLSFYVCQDCTQEEKEYKQQLLQNADIEKVHYVYLYSTKQYSKDYQNCKVVTALTKQLSCYDSFTDKKIIVLLPAVFKNEKPIFNPNQFCLKIYFYDRVRNYNKECGYNLYSFITKPEYNKQKIKPSSIVQYLSRISKIQHISIKDYLKNNYNILDERVKDASINLQKYLIKKSSKSSNLIRIITDE